MRAPVLHGPRTIRYEEVPDPHPGAGEVLLEVGLCGVCGSDLHLFDSDMAPDGIVLGHEYGATVRGCGKGVEGWSGGERVVATMLEPCLNCVFCRRGEFDLCYQHFRIDMQRAGTVRDTGASLGSGGYGPMLVTNAARLLRIPDEIDDRQAACVEPAAVGFHAVRNSGLRPGDRVAVLGAGPIGLFSLQCAADAGARKLVTVEPAAGRAAVAAALGASTTIDPRACDDVPAAVADALGGPPDVVFDAAGVPATLQQAVEIVKPGGHVMMVGVAFNNAPIKPSTWVTKRITLRAAFAYSRADYSATIDMLARGAIDVRPMVTSVMPARETAAAFERLLKPNTDIKILIDPHA